MPKNSHRVFIDAGTARRCDLRLRRCALCRVALSAGAGDRVRRARARMDGSARAASRRLRRALCHRRAGRARFRLPPLRAGEGQPRSLLDIRRQLADWRAAIAYARRLDGIDPERVALWGSSFSGGHVIELAAQDDRIAAVVAQVPFVDGLVNFLRLGRKHAPALTLAGLRDQAGALAGRPPYMVASVGPPGSTAVMNSPDAEPGFLALNPPGLAWPNEAPARIALRVVPTVPSARLPAYGARSSSRSPTTMPSPLPTSPRRPPRGCRAPRCITIKVGISIPT